MKLQKLTEKRWFWPALCAVSVVFGWWYLSITTCAPLGGDDELINLQNYYYITHTVGKLVCLRQLYDRAIKGYPYSLLHSGYQV